MELSVETISTVVGLLLLCATGGALYMELKMKLKALKEEIDELKCQRSECMEFFKDIRDAVSSLNTTITQTTQKLDDYIKWQKNGHAGGGG